LNGGWFNPLWPAGHLPHKGGEYVRSGLAPVDSLLQAETFRGRRKGVPRLFSPLVGEMAGRPEGAKAGKALAR